MNKDKPNINFASCPTIDCPYVYELSKDKNNYKPKFDCPVCDHSYCMKCKKEYHIGKECEIQGGADKPKQ